MSEELASVRATVYGRVQGVFFRSFTSRKARDLGLTGYVRNMPDGTVEVYAEGEKEKLEELIAALKVGPPAAKVEKVATHWSDYSGKYPGFVVSRY